MQKINKPANKKSLTKFKEEWFQEGLVFRQIIDYNKVKGVSMWSKDQKQYLDNIESRLSNKVDQVETRLNNKIEEVESRLNNKIDQVNQKVDQVETRLNNKIEQNSLAIKANAIAIKENNKEIKAVQSSVDEVLTIIKNINQRLN